MSMSGDIHFFCRGAPYAQRETSVQNHDKLSDHVQQFPRVLKKKTILTNKKYAENKRTNSCCVQLSSGSYAVIEQSIL